MKKLMLLLGVLSAVYTTSAFAGEKMIAKYKVINETNHLYNLNIIDNKNGTVFLNKANNFEENFAPNTAQEFRLMVPDSSNNQSVNFALSIDKTKEKTKMSIETHYENIDHKAANGGKFGYPKSRISGVEQFLAASPEPQIKEYPQYGTKIILATDARTENINGKEYTVCPHVVGTGDVCTITITLQPIDLAPPTPDIIQYLNIENDTSHDIILSEWDYRFQTNANHIQDWIYSNKYGDNADSGSSKKHTFVIPANTVRRIKNFIVFNDFKYTNKWNSDPSNRSRAYHDDYFNIDYGYGLVGELKIGVIAQYFLSPTNPNSFEFASTIGYINASLPEKNAETAENFNGTAKHVAYTEINHGEVVLTSDGFHGHQLTVKFTDKYR